MASIAEVRTSEAPAPLPVFSQAIKANGFVFCSGNIGFDKDTMKLVDGGIKGQTVGTLTRSFPPGRKADVSSRHKRLKT
jgi:2-iminobutanoate/2-iminopropanoate deaminase